MTEYTFLDELYGIGPYLHSFLRDSIDEDEESDDDSTGKYRHDTEVIVISRR